MIKKTLAISAPLVATAAVVAAVGVSGGTVQATSGTGHSSGPGISAARGAGDVYKCAGKAQKRAWDRGVEYYVQALSDDGQVLMPGSVIRGIKGPKRGHDILSVNFSALAYADADSYGRVRILLDGEPMHPSNITVGSEYFTNTTSTDDDGWGTVAQNYCAKIGRGGHSFRVTFQDFDDTLTGHSFYLKDPMVHVEQSN